MRPFFASHKTAQRAGITLVEIYVNVGMIVILSVILFPVFGRAREKARQSSCLSNQKLLGRGLMLYVNDYDGTFPPAEYEVRRVGRFTWKQLVAPYLASQRYAEDSKSGHGIFVCRSINERVPDESWAPTCGTPSRAHTLLSYGANVYLMPGGRNLLRPRVPAVVRGATVRLPESLVMLAPNMSTSPYLSGRDDRYDGAGKEEQGYMFARRRHMDGENYTFADGHARWFKAPEDYKSQSLRGVCWKSPRQGPQYAGCSGWFFPTGD